MEPNATKRVSDDKENSTSKESLLQPKTSPKPQRKRGEGSPKSSASSSSERQPSATNSATNSKAASSNANVLSLPTEGDENVPSGSTSSNNAIPKIKLPKQLQRPVFRPISRASIIAIEPSLEKVPIEYIQRKLKDVGERMFATTMKVTAQAPKGKLPEELEIFINESTPDLPTHILAICARSDTSPVKTLTLHPVHGIILAAHCANLSVLPRSQPPGGLPRVTLPVVTLSLPHPAAFSLLLRYLYMRRVQDVLLALFPVGIGRLLPEAHIKTTAETCTVNTILLSVYKTQGLWSDVVALGVFDEPLWRVIEYTWQTLLEALSLKTGATWHTL